MEGDHTPVYEMMLFILINENLTNSRIEKMSHFKSGGS